jgi:hypothetical protein
VKLSIALLLLAACGSSAPNDPPSVDGSWDAPDLTSSCGWLLRIDTQARTYRGVYICDLDNGGVGAMLEGGRVYDSPLEHTLRLIADRSSCPDGSRDRDVTFDYWFDRGNLVLQSDYTTFSFEAVKQEGGPFTGSVTTGCFNGGQFTASPEVALSY